MKGFVGKWRRDDGTHFEFRLRRSAAFHDGNLACIYRTTFFELSLITVGKRDKARSS